MAKKQKLTQAGFFEEITAPVSDLEEIQAELEATILKFRDLMSHKQWRVSIQAANKISSAIELLMSTETE